MEAQILNFTLSRHVQKGNNMVLKVGGIIKREDAKKFVGKKVVYKTESGKEINGKVASAHGNKGALRAVFERGMPGQSIGQKVTVE